MSQLRYISTAVFFIFIMVITAVVVSRLFTTGPPDVSQSPAAVYEQTLADQANEEFIAGKELFEGNNCSTCHRVSGSHSDLFTSAVQSEYWTSTNKIADFLRNPDSYSKEPYIQKIEKIFGQKMHIRFPDLTDEQMNLMYKYIITAAEKYSSPE